MHKETIVHLGPEALHQVKLSSKQIHILETYLRLAAQIGVEEVTLQKLATQAKVALGSVHYHFSAKKRELIDTAIRYVDQESVRFINYQLEERAASPDFKGIEEYINTLFDWIKHFPHHAQFYIFFFYHSSVNSQYIELNRTYIDLMKSRIAGLIYLSAGRGIYPAFKNVEQLAEEIHSQVYGALVLFSFDARPDRWEHYKSLAIRITEHLISSYLA